MVDFKFRNEINVFSYKRDDRINNSKKSDIKWEHFHQSIASTFSPLGIGDLQKCPFKVMNSIPLEKQNDFRWTSSIIFTFERTISSQAYVYVDMISNIFV